jgi:hypothetical protein
VKTNFITKPLLLVFLTAVLGHTPALPAAQAPAKSNSASASVRQDTSTDHMVIQLGNIQVKGQRQIIKVLQAIKVALRQPISTDPKLADVLVCRLQNQVGSHIKQWLECGTNRILLRRQYAVHTAMDAAVGGETEGVKCVSSECYGEVFSALNQVIENQPGNYLHAAVDGPGLRALLTKIPNPVPAKPATIAKPPSKQR